MQPAVHLSEGLFALGLGLGRHQVGDPLGLGEIEAACLEGAAGELAGLGRAQAGKARERVRERVQDRRPAVDVELRHVLARGAGRRREPEGKAPVDGRARLRLAEAPQRGPARLRQRRAADPRERLSRRGARDPDHRDGGARPAAGEREDGVAGHVVAGRPAPVPAR